jgi:RNA polymerase sigma factor, sigma-70 family
MNQQELLPHLFITEYRKIIAVLCKRFGFDEMETAEDIASDTFLTAAQTWPVKGLPHNPVAWLYNVAKNKANNFLLRSHLFDTKIAPAIKSETAEAFEIDLSPESINDSQLQMMFAVCHPAISTEAQVGLSLRILCGFGIVEIADTVLTSRETVNKRLFRARGKLREEKIAIELPGPAAMEECLNTVLTTIYLLFSEGNYSTTSNEVLRRDFCLEAMQLCYMLAENPFTYRSQVNALLSLMCFHASRFGFYRAYKQHTPFIEGIQLK